MSDKSLFKNEAQEPITIFVETLTGKTFQLKVSPQDTVRAIKYKIQKVEGIPMSHQHLLHNSKELEDSLCITGPPAALQDQSTIKLVLSMRGGPISLVPQLVPMNRALRDLAKMNRDNMEELPPGCKMAVVVLRVGDELNLLHVIEDVEEPFDSLANDKTHLPEFNSVLAGESLKTVQENAVMKGKMNHLREKLAKLSLADKAHKDLADRESLAKEYVPMKLPSIIFPVPKKILSARRQFSQVPILPDIVPNPLANVSRASEVLSLDSKATSAKLCEAVRPKTCPSYSSGSHLGGVIAGRCVSSYPFVRAAPPIRCTKEEILALRQEFQERLRRRRFQSLNNLPPITNVPQRTQCTHQKVSTNETEPETDQSGPDAHPVTDKLNVNHEEFVGSQNKLDLNRTVPTLRSESACPYSTPNFKPELQQDPINRVCWSGLIGNTSSRQLPKRYSIASLLGNLPYKTTSDSKSVNISNKAQSKEAEPELNGKIENLFKNTRLRCTECKKRLTVCTTFECRCGFYFCPYHRYSEAHHCTYDFKKDRQKLMSQETKSVLRPKLPKI